MANKILVKHRRGTTAEWQKWLSIPSNYLLDGELALEDVIEPEGKPNRLRLLIGDGKWHTYETLVKIDIPGYAQYSDQGAVLASGYDYAEYFQWSGDVIVSDRVIGRFVTIVENTRTIRLAQPGDKVLGITTATASIIGNYSEDKQANTDWVRVGMLGIVEVEHDTTCTANGYAMVGTNGKATLTNEPFGYKIVKVDASTIRPIVEVVLGNDSDMISRIKQDITNIGTNMEWGEWE